MFTIRQMERLWNAKQYRRLALELLSGRAEASYRLEAEFGRSIPAAALALIRMDELTQSHHPLYRTLLNVLILGQEADGGWGDVMTSALCVRALTCGDGQGVAVERGLAYLAQLQKSDGLWPKVPIRRMSGDAFVSAFVLFELVETHAFRQAVRLADVVDWFAANLAGLDPDTRRLWDRAAAKCRTLRPRTAEATGLWS
ncbi:MAG TPA: hypothetical protein VGR35_03535 [Tepidisphaeraceae bacterium]|nr:hypothetical protein [Tepidisphaeraceae bacterium]